MSKYQYKKSKRYENVYSYNTQKGLMYMYKLRYYDEFGKRKEKSESGFADEKTAYRKSLEMLINIDDNEIAKVNPTSLTVGQWYDKWIEINSQWSDNTKASRVSAGRDYIKPFIGHIKLKDLDLMKYEILFIKQLEKVHISEDRLMQPSTIELYHTYMNVCINAAVKRDLLHSNKIVDATLPKIEDKRVKYVTLNDLNTIIADVYKNEPISNYIIIIFLAFTGCRVGELLAMTWNDIDLDNKMVTIKASRKHNKVSSTKNKKVRRIPISEQVVSDLKKYRAWYIQRLFKDGKSLTDDDFVFISEQKGTKIAQTTITYLLKRVKKRIGINITPHGFRHTHATILAGENMSFMTIAKRLGNTPEVVISNYAHVTEEMETKLVDVFDEKLKVVELLVELSD
ncbi:tyrosine-type recombinase/integrase [Macrococcoides bohemicum]|uniref:tyrosine-type recombinase/integrase n=1 Tax=Macrococcoides bohemicum TaxID=1903056 RepID=UPI00165E759A|nr:site-specific integrase [Macrococcus bohemicus]MBC9873657.1 tyrosine-type recombinase/integrase [Macrococcus bohemicus]